jgi:hypothetical protein
LRCRYSSLRSPEPLPIKALRRQQEVIIPRTQGVAGLISFFGIIFAIR